MSGRGEAAAAVPIPTPLEAPDRTDGGALHGRIRRMVLERILSGESGPGDRVGVSALAAETGISRTPVRESLLQLQREGFLTLEENRGFFVRPLTEREARELYPIVHALEHLALATVGRASRAQIERLEALNDRLAASGDAAEAIALNFAWHRLLTSPCANRELERLLDRYRMRIYRYEHAYYGPGEERIAYSVELHGEILTALRAGDVRTARAVLERHWIGDYSLYLPAGAGGGAAVQREPANPADRGEGGVAAAAKPDRS